MFKKTLVIFILMLMTGCSAWVQESTVTARSSVTPWETPTPRGTASPWETPTPFEKVVTMVSEDPPRPQVMETFPPTPGDTGLTPVVGDLQPVLFDTLEMIAIPPATYTDPHAGFAFDYPAAWQVSPPVDAAGAGVYTMSVISFGRITPEPKQQEGIPAGHAKIEVVVFQDREYSFEEAVNSQRQQREMESGAPLVMDEGWLLPSGLPARRWVVDGFAGRVNLIITAINGRKVIIAGYGEPGLFNVIAGSLHPVE